jgi:hypothetical protein
MEFMTAGATVDRIAAYCRIEQGLFALLGAWAPEIDDAAAKALSLELADHAAWRARRWYEMLPAAPPGPDSFLDPTTRELEVFACARAIGGGSGAAPMAVVSTELLPRLVGAMGEHLAVASAVAQGPVRRILDIAITDVDRDLTAARAAGERLTASPQGRTQADGAIAEVASVLSRLGGIVDS